MGAGSLPSRGAWVEIKWGKLKSGAGWSLPSRGAWVEISPAPSSATVGSVRRSPPGERGLKCSGG